MNVYEPLLFYKGGSTSEFEPRLATEWKISPDGKAYRFKIRKGVKFHDGTPLTPEDVEYSFERAMVQDRDGGPVWMLLEPLLGVDSTRGADGKIAVKFEDIDKAVEVEGDWVVFHLKKPYPPFLQILAMTWGSIVCKKWAIAQGDWDGTAATWEKFNNPKVPPLQKVMNGTGPFKLERWDPGVELVLVRNDNYWRGPAKLKRVIFKVVSEWTTRRLMLEAGDADWVYVPRAHIKELEGVKGIRVYKNLPTLQNAAIFFNFKIDSNSPYIGSGKLDGKGIPPDFFSDENVRLGFAHLLDFDTYIKEALLGEARQPGSPIIQGLPFFDPKEPKYSYDKKKAEEYLKKAWGGKLWEKGMELTILYNVGNEERKTACDMLMWELVRLNPKFKVRVQAVPWASYLRDLVGHKLALFLIGWLADYPDPHNFIYPYMHSKGTFAKFQGYSNPEVDKLIEEGISTMDPTKRAEIYSKLRKIYYEDVISLPLHQPLMRRYERDWVKGWYYNPLIANMQYVYPLSKGY